MKTFRLALSLLLLSVVGCSDLSPQIQTAHITGTATRVTNRHDTYVNADTTLPAATKTADLAQSAFVRSELTKPQVPASELAPALNAVSDRTDAYDKANTTLPAYKLKANLQDTAILREVLTAGAPK